MYKSRYIVAARMFCLEASVGVKSHGASGNFLNQRAPCPAINWVYMWTIGTGCFPTITVPYIFLPLTVFPLILRALAKYSSHVQPAAGVLIPSDL